MGLESSPTYISDLNSAWPLGTDVKSAGDNHIRNIKSTLLATFPSITGAVTATHAELNLLDGVTASTAELNLLDGVTATTAELNLLAGAGASGAGMLADIGALTDPNADRLLFWDDSAGAVAQLAPDGTSIAISGTTLAVGSNVPLKNASNTFTNATQIITGTAAKLVLIDSGTGDAHEGRTEIQTADVAGKAFRIFSALDDGTAQNELLLATRSGANWSALTLAAGTITLSGTGETLATFADDGAVTLYYDNAAKLATASGGVSVTGALTASTGLVATAGGLTVSAGGIDVTGNVTRPNASASEVGYAGSPLRSITSSDNTAASDAGKTIRMTSGSGQTLTLDGDPPTDSRVTIINSSGNNWTLSASGTLSHPTIGTGSRTMATGSTAIAHHLGSGSWYILATGGTIT